MAEKVSSRQSFKQTDKMGRWTKGYGNSRISLPIIGGNCYKYDFCHDKTHQNIFVTTIMCLLRQAYFHCDKRCVSPRQTCLLTFAATKIIFVAAPANDTFQLCYKEYGFKISLSFFTSHLLSALKKSGKHWVCLL